jgi:hypothetical protein
MQQVVDQAVIRRRHDEVPQIADDQGTEYGREEEYGSQ